MTASPLVPVDKHDVAAVERAKKAGWPAIQPVLHELLAWLQDGNWPVAGELGPVLASIGHLLSPAIQPLLAGSDALWEYWILRLVVRPADPELSRALSTELRRIATAPTPDEQDEEVDALAQTLLAHSIHAT